MTVSFWQQAASQEPRRYDYIVVGGGIVGVSAAYWYHKAHPDHKVALLEARTLASGASGRNAGFVLQGTSTDYVTDIERYGPDIAGRMYRMTCENRDLLESELDIEQIEFRSGGSIIAAGSLEEDRRLQQSVGPLRAAGGRVIHLTADETNRRLQSRGFYGSLMVSTGATVHPVKLVNEIARLSEATIIENRYVDAISAEAAGVILHSGSEKYTAPVVTLALNAYLPRLIPSLAGLVAPVRAQMLATEPVSSIDLGYPVYSHDGYFYLRQTQNGSLLVGGARHLHVEEEQGYDDKTTPRLQSDLEAYIEEYFPRAIAARITDRWSGVMGFSQDGLPLIGRVPGIGGPQYWAGGFTGHGMSIGFLVGRTLAKLASGQQRILEMEILDASRLSRRKTSESVDQAAST